MFEQLVTRWGYVAIAFGTYVEGEAVLLSAAALTRSGVVSLPLVIAAAWLGSFAWGQTWFHVGRRSGRALVVRRPEWQARIELVQGWLTRFGPAVLLVGRFLVGMGTLLPATVGASEYSWRRFSLFDAAGALLWACVFAAVGCGVSAALSALGFGWHTLTAPDLVALLLAVALLAWLAPRLYALLAPRLSTRAPSATGDAAPTLKRLIITGDDFGLSESINDAIERAYREGVLTTTSLLVGEVAAADAIERARRNPGLRVGLHLAVCDGQPTLPVAQIPALVNARGALRGPLSALLRLALLGPRGRRQLEAEIRAQFEALRATGLSADHVNGHNNMQLHPVVLPILMRVAAEHGIRAIRLPFEPLWPSWRAARRALLPRLVMWLVMKPWSAYVKGRLTRAGFIVNDYLFGLFDYGAIDGVLLARWIDELPAGLSEIHCHPSTERAAHEAELFALLDPSVRAALARADVRVLQGFGAVEPAP